MTTDEIQSAQAIISALTFLRMEAENSGLDRVATLLKICARDICAAIEANILKSSEKVEIVNTDLFAVLECYRLYSSIKDKQVKRQFLISHRQFLEDAGEVDAA